MTARVYRDPKPDAPAEPTTGIRPRERLTREEVAELVAVRGLLCELRPGALDDPRGPLSWSPMARPPAHEEPAQGALARRIRVQQSTDPSPVPKDAFASAAPLASGTEMDLEVRRIAREGGAVPARTLTWLQREGTVVDGLPALCVALADALAPEALRARWAARGAALSLERRRQWGLDAILWAARWWRGERPVCADPDGWPRWVGWCGDAAMCGTGGTIGAAPARCQRPEKVRVRGPRCRRCVG